MFDLMINRLKQTLTGKKICILGFGREGQSTYHFLLSNAIQADITIADKNPINLAKQGSTTIKTGDSYLSDLEKFDIIIKTPGISLKNEDITLYKDKLSSQMDLFLQTCTNKVIGITGTKGKSTTSTLLFEVLKHCNQKTILAGNIGIPVFDIIPDLEQETVIILELSSHQLEYIKSSPDIAVFLNIYKEHLDHYNSYEDYIDAKCNIFRYQNQGDIFLYNSSQEIINRKINQFPPPNPWAVDVSGEKNTPVKTKTYIADNTVTVEDTRPHRLCPADLERKLPGDHNLLNILFVLSITHYLKLHLPQVLEAIAAYSGLPHRLEYVDTIDDITYYNDSIATIPEATVFAIKSLKKVDTLIAGGMNRGIDYESLTGFLANSRVNNIFLLPDTGKLLKKQIESFNPGHGKNIILFNSLDEAVLAAHDKTSPGSICLLSPAAPSYGFFKNFEDRGDRFKSLVRSLGK